MEAFLTYPADFRADRKYPLIVNIHGGPHGQQGPAFNFKNQVYASHGWATLMVNYRGLDRLWAGVHRCGVSPIRTATKRRMCCTASARRCAGICGSIATGWGSKAPAMAAS